LDIGKRRLPQHEQSVRIGVQGRNLILNVRHLFLRRMAGR
jgi:hypothetical protein